MKFGRIMVVVGVLAALALAAAGIQGYRGAAAGAGLSEHILLGLTALLLFVLSHAWVLFYTLGLTRVLEETAREMGREGVLDPRLLAFRRRTLPPSAAAVAAGLAAFLLGTGVYAGSVSATVHGAFLWVTLALQVWAVPVEWRTLAATERAVKALER